MQFRLWPEGGSSRQGLSLKSYNKAAVKDAVLATTTAAACRSRVFCEQPTAFSPAVESGCCRTRPSDPSD